MQGKILMFWTQSISINKKFALSVHMATKISKFQTSDWQVNICSEKNEVFSPIKSVHVNRLKHWSRFQRLKKMSKDSKKQFSNWWILGKKCASKVHVFYLCSVFWMIKTHLLPFYFNLPDVKLLDMSIDNVVSI